MLAYRPSLRLLLVCVMGADGIAAARLARCVPYVSLPLFNWHRHLHVGLFESVETAWLALGSCWWESVSEACTCPFCAILAWCMTSYPEAEDFGDITLATAHVYHFVHFNVFSLLLISSRTDIKIFPK